jgi:class 3 adenylate cyclase/tetratricopeptide (TPR) repeat protein
MLSCPACGTANPEGARFCNACGGALVGPGALRKERKVATALFADLVGSTALTEREDPEIVQSVIGLAFDRIAAEISRHEGLLEKFMGDAVLAVFGVPRAHEDDAERAVRAAIEMQGLLAELNRELAAEGKPTLAMRIGIEAGEVLVDLERATGPRDRMITGDAVNTAARLQAAAEPGHIVVGPGVHASTKEVIEYRELGPIALKGKREPVLAWRALRIRARTRGERSRLGLEARLVGRDEELAVMEQTLRRVETEGRPALLTIVGPAGVGKSRLVSELERLVEERPDVLYWRRGRCLAYGNPSYSAFAEAIKAQCEIAGDDPAEVAARKADAALAELGGDERLAPALHALVGAAEARGASREELFDAWRSFLERMAARYPLVLALEDLHWADDGLLDLVEHVADWAQGPILIVATARAELFDLRPGWGGGKRNAVSLSLDPLSVEEGEAMLDELLHGSLEPALKRTIVSRSEGNPLFLEEIVRKLIDEGVLRPTEADRWVPMGSLADVEIPGSVQRLIAERLDGLPLEDKLVLQDAAVIGRVFWLGAVAELTGLEPDEVRRALGRLRQKELVVRHEPSSFSHEEEFAFRHNLIRDGAYDALPKALRADKHAGVARWASRSAGDRAEGIAALVATHLLEAIRYLEELAEVGPRLAELQAEAFRWAAIAAERSASLWLQAEAVRWFRTAERLADELGLPPEDRIDLARAHALSSWGLDEISETERVVRRALAIATALGDPVAAGWAHARLVLPLLMEARDEDAEAAGRRAVAILEPLGEREELADAMNRLGWYLWRRGRTEEAEPLLRRAVAMAERVGSRLVAAESTQTLGVCLAYMGRPAEAVRTMEEAYRLAKEVGDFANLMRCSNNLPSVLADLASDHERALAVLEEGLEAARRAGARSHTGWLMGGRGDVLFRLGRLREAEAAQREAIEVARSSGDQPLIGMRLSGLAVCLAYQGRLDEAEAAHRESVPIIRANPEPQSWMFVPLIEGYLALARGRREEAIAAFRRTIELLEPYTFEPAPEAFADLVRLLVRDGRAEEAAAYRTLRERGRAPATRANALVVEGLLAEDPAEAVRALAEAVGGFDAVGMRVDAARARIDLARAMARRGEDPRSVLDEARTLLADCGAAAFTSELEEALAAG